MFDKCSEVQRGDSSTEMSSLYSNNLLPSLSLQTMLTAISMSAIATNGVVPG